MKQTLNDKPDCSNSPSTGGLGELEPEEFWSVFEKGVACEKKKKADVNNSCVCSYSVMCVCGYTILPVCLWWI